MEVASSVGLVAQCSAAMAVVSSTITVRWISTADGTASTAIGLVTW